MDERLAAPFPYNGGKRRWAADVWARFGDDRVVYLEPFCGSMAILLANPRPCRREIVCDMSPHIANFWRAVKADPDAVAFHADYPTIHHDLRARHAWLARWAEENGERVLEDPEHCDAKAAGWWAWGKSHWIGGMFPTDPPRDTRPHVAGRIGAQGVSMHRSDSIPHVGNVVSGRGVSMERIGLEKGVPNGARLAPWMRRLAERLAGVIVLRRPWASCVTNPMLTDKEPVAVFLDPPYLTSGRSGGLYGSDAAGGSDDAAREAYGWAVERGGDPRLRVAYCCREGDFPVPDGWTALTRGFMGVRLAERRRRRDLLMFSPHCVDVGLFK